MSLAQVSLFGHDEPRCDPAFARLERVALGHDAWIDLAPGWLQGHAQLFEHLRRWAPWRADDRVMYDKRVDVPRLHASLPLQGRHIALAEMRRLLDARYLTSFDRVTAALYRDGRDSVAWHGDYVAREMNAHTVVATVSLGTPRRFLVRPTGGGRSVAFTIGWGDLLVMGGACQRTHQHCIPKVAHAGPRIALMFRPTWNAPPAAELRA